MSVQPVMNLETRRKIRTMFEAAKGELFSDEQTFEGWRDQTQEVFGKIFKETRMDIRDLEDSEEAQSAFVWALRSYSMLLAPWSPVTLIVQPVAQTRGKGFGIKAAIDLEKNTILYELSTMLTQDLNAHYTDLSLIWHWDEDVDTQHLAVGAGRLVNHSRKPNAEFVHLDQTWGFTIQTNRKIRKEEEILINYGSNYGLDEKQRELGCDCDVCADQTLVGIISTADRERQEEKRSKKKTPRQKEGEAARNSIRNQSRHPYKKAQKAAAKAGASEL
ncbi:hypothetical protein C8R43DRAFT_1140940 [Mycena crocata]|nr:hypothetical protein C8R43DRAFT_1140940 [Mycena crocata]